YQRALKISASARGDRAIFERPAANFGLPCRAYSVCRRVPTTPNLDLGAAPTMLSFRNSRSPYSWLALYSCLSLLGCVVGGADANGDTIADDLGVAIDADRDGRWDQHDFGFDGTLDGLGADTDRDGFTDAVVYDLDRDGIYESLDLDGDGVIDKRSDLVPPPPSEGTGGGTGGALTGTGGGPETGGAPTGGTTGAGGGDGFGAGGAPLGA